MTSNLSWMLNEKILLLEYEGQIDSPLIDSSYAEISDMLGQVPQKQAYLLVDISNSDKGGNIKDYEYLLLSQLDTSQVKAVIVISKSLEPLKPLTQRIERERSKRSLPQILFGTDREIAFNYLAQIVDKQDVYS